MRMSGDQDTLAKLAAKEEIRELALLYCRGVDRKDIELLKTLYAKGATDFHGDTFSGSAEDYIAFLEASLPYMRDSGHHVCNHLISVDGDRGEGEVYAAAWHIYDNPDGKGGAIEDFMTVRYIDRYCKEDGRWKFADRLVTYDYKAVRPIPMPEAFTPTGPQDPSFERLSSRLFARGPRA
jgi:hypothetical protein